MYHIQSALAIPDLAIADTLVYRMAKNLKFLYQQNLPVIPDIHILMDRMEY